ncbi:hypothetical protein HUJ04_012747 [Dendroctonus ponderosae]|nr:hypothetical protein HUJ04_012747 [Dendroctonus ponderosae]
MLLSAMVFCALRFETVATFTLSIQTPGPDRPSGRRRRIVSSPEATFTPLLASATSLDILKTFVCAPACRNTPEVFKLQCTLRETDGEPSLVNLQHV